MYIEVVLPNVGFGMEEGRLLTWLKSPGDSVHKGEPLAEVEGDKTTVELEALADGVLDEIVVPADTVVPIGTVLARIRSGEASGPSASRSNAVTATATETAAQPETNGKAQVSPVARRLAQEHDIDLNTVTGSGRGGRITREDVEAALGAGSAASSQSIGRPGSAQAGAGQWHRPDDCGRVGQGRACHA